MAAVRILTPQTGNGAELEQVVNREQQCADRRFERRMRRRQWNGIPFAAPTPEFSPLRSRPLISVVLPVYNHARYLRASLESTLAAAVHYPLQIIVVNDGSTDDFATVITPFRNDPRVVIVEQANGGIAAALNAGFRRAEGPLLSWTSADNRYRPGALDRLADFLLANPSVGLTFGNVQLIDDGGNVLHRNGYRLADQLGNLDGMLFLPTSGASLADFPDNFVNACFLYRSTLSDAIGGYDQSLHGCEDYDYWLRIAAVCEVVHVDTDDVLYEYRLHGDTLTANLQPPRLLHDVERILESARRTRARQRLPQLTGVFDRTASYESFVRQLSSPSARTKAKRPVRPAGQSADLLLEFESGAGERSTIALRAIPTGAARVSALDRLLFGDADPLAFSAAHSATERRGVLFTACDLPPFLRRARGANFLAVEPDARTHGVCGIFLEQLSPDERTLLLETVALLVSAESGVTVALVCSCDAERAVADSLHLQLPDSSQLRIVDLTEESKDPERFSRSLTYVLSALDLIIAPNVTRGDRDLCRSVGLARVAAAAGLSVLPIGRTAVDSTLELTRFVAHIPNLLAPLPLSELLVSLSAAMAPPDQRSLEQLLIESSTERCLRNLLAFAAPVSS